MGKQHAPQFLNIVNDAKTRIQELTIDQFIEKRAQGGSFILIDVREESEWARGHLPDAKHLGKGIIERDVEQEFPDPSAELILYCGGGFRSALAADNLQKMGYTNVWSLDGGFRGWKEAEQEIIVP